MSELIALFFDPHAWLSLLTLTVLEIVLGIDNLIFLSIVSGRLPRHQQKVARQIGLAIALVARLVLLASIVWLAGLKEPIVTLFDRGISWRDIILLGGGLFLLVKATLEIDHLMEGQEEEPGKLAGGATIFANAIVQIVLLDIVFSFDSILTAVGLARELPIMIIAVIIAILVMLLAAESVGGFVNRHPTIKMLALAFLILIGMSLVAESFHFEIPRGYLYFAVGFSLAVEGLNLAMRRRRGV